MDLLTDTCMLNIPYVNSNPFGIWGQFTQERFMIDWFIFEIDKSVSHISEWIQKKVPKEIYMFKVIFLLPLNTALVDQVIKDMIEIDWFKEWSELV